MPLSLKALKLKCKAIQSTQKVVDAMRLIYASRFQFLEKRLKTLHSSFECFYSVVANIWHTSTEIERIELRNAFLQVLYSQDTDLLQSSGSDKSLSIVITANKSLCGGFNNAIIKLAVSHLQSTDLDDKEAELIFIGQKGFQHFTRLSYSAIVEHYTIPKLKCFDFVAVRDSVIIPIMSHIARLKPSSLNIVYSYFKSSLDQEPRVEDLLSIPCSTFHLKDNFEFDNFGSNTQYFIENDNSKQRAKVFAGFMEQYCINRIYQAIFNTTIGEYAARMVAMENAANNAQEMLDKMRLLYNSRRQAKITQELIEVIAGSEIA